MPTATQLLGEGHDTSFHRVLRAPGKGSLDQLVPFQCSIRPPESGTEKPFPRAPTAMQLRADVQETPDKNMSLSTMVLQLRPSQRAMPISTDVPIAIQDRVDPHETVSPASGGGSWRIQFRPFQRSPMEEHPAAPSQFSPTAMHIVSAGQETPVRSPLSGLSWTDHAWPFQRSTSVG